ncbi:MAG: acyl-CoA thioesterase [Clostridiales bacterium]|nr:acyl-CoA thioesterase [Clostridiales bacterium]
MSAKDRTVTLTMIMEPHHANLIGSVHGGEIMRFMDTTAGCTAIKYAKNICVTARVDELQFLKPIHLGNFVTCTGTVAYTGKTSVEIRVTVDTEDIRDSQTKGRAIEAFFTLVALDKDGLPTPVPAYVPETKREKELYEHVKTRREFDRQRHEAAKKKAEAATTS